MKYLTACTCVLVWATALGAQSQRDSVTVACDSLGHRASETRGPCAQAHHAILGALYALVLAPSGILCFADTTVDSVPKRGLGFSRDHVSVSLSGGVISAATDTDAKYSTWARSAAVEVLRGRLLIEARAERFLMPERLDYVTIRVGRMSHRVGRVAGGVTVGFRDVEGPRSHSGVELGFPLVVGGPGGWLRLETSYVFSSKQSSWNYRAQWERLQGHGPLFVGARLDLNSFEIRRGGQISHGVLGVLAGFMVPRR